MNPALRILQEKTEAFINTNFKIEVVADDCQFTEGPVWNAKGYYLFSDIVANCIHKLQPGKRKELFIDKSGTSAVVDGVRPDHAGSNGLAYNNDGRLLICQHGNGAIAKWDDSLQPLATTYNGRRFNGPNDLVMAKNGRLFFSDPPYGLVDTKLNTDLAQPIAGVYCWEDEELKLVCDKYTHPNGVCLTPDESELFICSNKPHERFVSVYDAQTLVYKRVFAEENGDGMKCDRHGNVYLCAKEGIVVVDGDGKRIAILELPTIPANLCWGGNDGKDLCITARENVFLINGFLL